MLKVKDIHKIHTIKFGDLKNGDFFEYQTDYYMKFKDIIINSKSKANAIQLETELLAHFDSDDYVMPIHENNLTIEK